MKYLQLLLLMTLVKKSYIIYEKKNITNENLNNVASGPIATMPLREAREAFEREYLITQINRFNGNISKTAKFVGMERSALHRKLKSLGVVSISRTQKEDG